MTAVGPVRLRVASLPMMTNAAIPALQALFVTVLWSSSWVLIKLGLAADLAPLTFASLRYAVAAACLAAVVAASGVHRSALRGLSRSRWIDLGLLGLVFITVTQGAQFLALELLPANMLSLVLSATPAVVAVAGGALLAEPPSRGQWSGIGVYAVAVGLYFWGQGLAASQPAGLVVAFVCLGANAAAALLGRATNRRLDLHPLVVTTVSMGVGAVALLAVGLGVEGLPRLSARAMVLVGWLAVVNTALAFTLWNHTLRRLPAVQSSVINNTMLIQIAGLAWVFLGERLTGVRIVALGVAAAGILVVQLHSPGAARDAVRATPPAPEPATR